MAIVWSGLKLPSWLPTHARARGRAGSRILGSWGHWFGGVGGDVGLQESTSFRWSKWESLWTTQPPELSVWARPAGLPVCPSLCPSVLDANITVSVRPSVHPSPGPQPFSLESPQPENRIAASQPGCCRRNFTSLYFTYLHPQDYKQAGPARPSRRLPLLHSLARSLACVEIRVELSWVLATSFHLEQHLISSHLPGPEEPAYPSSGLEQDKHFLPAGVQDYDRGERTGSQLQMNRLSLRHDRLK